MSKIIRHFVDKERGVLAVNLGIANIGFAKFTDIFPDQG